MGKEEEEEILSEPFKRLPGQERSRKIPKKEAYLGRNDKRGEDEATKEIFRSRSSLRIEHGGEGCVARQQSEYRNKGKQGREGVRGCMRTVSRGRAERGWEGGLAALSRGGERLDGGAGQRSKTDLSDKG